MGNQPCPPHQVNLFSRLQEKGKKPALFHQVNLWKKLQMISPFQERKRKKNSVLHLLTCCSTVRQWPVIKEPFSLEASSIIFFCKHLPLFRGSQKLVQKHIIGRIWVNPCLPLPVMWYPGQMSPLATPVAIVELPLVEKV